MSAHEALSRALAELNEAGRRTPCAADPERWTGEDVTTHDAAALDCAGCPAFAPCRAAGLTEDWGAWGGTVRTKTTRRKRTA